MRTMYLGFSLLLIFALVVPGLAQGGQAENNAYTAFYNEKDLAKKADLGEKFLAEFKESNYRSPVLQGILGSYLQAQNWTKILEHAEKLPAELPNADNKVKGIVYTYGMAAAQATNNAAKTVEYGEKVLTVDPNNLQAQISVAATIPMSTPQDKAANDKAIELANKALAGVQQYFGQPKPASMTDAQWKQARSEYEEQLHSALGLIHFNRMDYVKSGDEYQTVLKSNPKDAVAHFYLGVGLQNQTAAASKAVVQAINDLNAAKTAKADQPTLDELEAKSQALKEDFDQKRDKGIDSLATAVAIGDQRVLKQAQEYLEKLYMTKNNDSLNGLTELIAQKKQQIGQ